VPMDEPIPYALTDLAHRQRLASMTEQMAYVEQVSMDLFQYVRAVDGLPRLGRVETDTRASRRIGESVWT